MSARRDGQVRQIKFCVWKVDGGGGNTSLINAAHALAQEAAGLAKSQLQEVQHLAGGAENWVKEKTDPVPLTTVRGDRNAFEDKNSTFCVLTSN